MQNTLTNLAQSIILYRNDHKNCIKMQKYINKFSFLEETVGFN